jgi:hypothetical protein
MINIISSKASAPNALLQEVPRRENEDNLRWLSRQPRPGEDQTGIVLVGGTSTTSFRLRVAQSHVRHDLMPSYWSHATLLGQPARTFATTPVYEISLEPPQGFTFPPPTNGLQQGRISQYRDPKLYPNIALLNTPVSLAQVMEALAAFQRQRAVLDGVELLTRWLTYVWGVARAGNPLLDGYGIPAAAMLEIAFGVAGYDLTPGLESRSSCPEAIWQAVKWWHEYYVQQNRQALSGAYYVGHTL